MLAGCMVLFPKLARTYPILERFKQGLWVGIFAPVDEQADIVFSRIVTRLTSDQAQRCSSTRRSMSGSTARAS